MRKFLVASSFIVPLLIFGGVNSGASLSPQTTDDRLHCVSSEGVWAEKNSCGRGELLVKVYNNCGEKVDIKICILRDNGTWSCGWDTRAAGMSMTLWDCNSSPGGEYKIWARRAGSNLKFPEP